MKKVIYILSILLSLICAENIFAQSTVSITGPPSVEVGVPYNFTFEFEPDWQSGKYLENIPDSFTITEWEIRTGTTFYGQNLFGYMGDVNNKSNLYTIFTNNNMPLTIPIQWGDGTFITNDFVEVKVSGHYSLTNYGVTKYFYDVTKKLDLKVERMSPPAITGNTSVLNCDQTTTTYSVNNYTNANQLEWVVSNGAQIVGSNTGTSVAVKPPLTGNFDIKCTVKRTAANPNYSVSAIKTVTRTPKMVSYKTFPLYQNYFCIGTGLTFQIDNQSGVSSVDWNAPDCTVSNETIINGIRQVTITPNNYVINGTKINISANVNFIGGCSSITPTKSFIVGTTKPIIQAINISEPGNYIDYVLVAQPFFEGATYNWYVNNILEQSNPFSSIDLSTTCGVPLSVTCTITNSCGTSVSSLRFRISGLCNQSPYFSIYPNPAGDELKISYTETLDTEVDPILSCTLINLYDKNGKIHLSSEFKNNQKEMILDTSHIPNGTYFLHIGKGKELIKKQVIINHQ